MNYNWDWSILISDPYLGWLASGFGWTIFVSLAAWLLAFSVGTLLGILRVSSVRGLQVIGTFYVEIFRNIPLLVQLFLWYFVFPELLPEKAGMWVKRELPLPEVTTAVIALGLYTASRVCEQVRSGVESVGRNQANAGRALGLTEWQTLQFILLPLAFRRILPPLTSEFLTIFKNSSLALTIGVIELTSATRQIEEYTFQGFEAFTAATVIYSAITLTVMGIMHRIESKSRVHGMLGSAR
jgi:glutamate/aspartate transport system permease protein